MRNWVTRVIKKENINKQAKTHGVVLLISHELNQIDLFGFQWRHLPSSIRIIAEKPSWNLRYAACRDAIFCIYDFLDIYETEYQE